MPAPVLQFKRGNAGVAGTVPALRPGEPAISLNNFDLFIGIDTSVSNNKFFGSHRYWTRENGTNSLKLNLVDKDGTNAISIKSPDTLAGSGTYTLPDTSTITDGYYLKTNSTGDLSWDQVVSNIIIDADSGTPDNVSTGSTITFAGGSNVNTVVTDNTITINLDDDISISGIGTFTNGLVADNVRLGIGGNGVVDTTSGTLYLDSADGVIVVNNRLDVLGDIDVNGNVYIGGTTVTLRSEDVFIQNKDIVLGYTTSITPNDTTANHAGVAIASTEGSPLVSFSASGINTLPNTYKQMMWFRTGTLGFATDVFAFNYGVAIGTTTMEDGVRLAVGTGVTISDTSVSASTFYGSLVGSVSGNVSSADQVKTVTASDTNANYYITFVDSHNGSAANETVYTDDGIYYNPGTNTFATQNVDFTGNAGIDGTLTVGTGVGITQFSGSVSTGTSTSSVPTSSAVIDYVSQSIGGLDLTLGIDADTGGPSSVTTSQTLTIAGTANEVQTSVSGQTITVGLTTNVTVSNDLTVQGNLYVNGNTTQVNTTALTVEDRTIDLGVVNGATPSSGTTWDLGVLFNYFDTAAKKSGVIWEHSTTRFQFASTLTSETGSTDSNNPQIVTATFAPIEIGALWVTDCAGTSQVISCTGTERFLENITVDAGQF